ncbi:universal stress protein [Actibacterium sp.]|uniref:universal stress protein n=1 Tax=Actibacterium sp. TaxID=1872125 RepID=UPI00356260D0
MYKKILLPVALDHGRDNAEALRVAQALVDEGGEICALTVVEPIPGYVSQYLPEEQEQASRKKVLATLTEVVAGLEGVTPEVVVGHAGRAIVDFADEHGCDCIIIASHQPGLQDYFLGSTASRVVRHAHCAVHVIR